MVLAAGCGGGTTTGAERPRAVAPGGGPAPASEEERAAVLFAELSTSLDKLEQDAPVDVPQVEAKLQQIVQLDPRNKAARFNLAALAQRSGDGAAAQKVDARKVYEELVAEDPGFSPAVENLAAFVVQDGDTNRAVAMYRGIIRQDSKNITSRLALARILVSERNYEEAIDLCRKVLQRQANAVEAFRVLADAYRKMGNRPMAELTIGRGLKVDASDVELHRLLAEIFLQREELVAGVNKLKQVIRMDPKRWDVRARLANIAMSYRDFGNAAQQYEAILKEKPNYLGARIALAVCYKGMGRFEQAEGIYKDILAADKANLDALWNLAVLYHHHLLKYDEAIALYNRYRQEAGPSDKLAQKVGASLADIDKVKSDMEAARLQAEKEKKMRDAIAAACKAVAAGSSAEKQAQAVGSEQERIQVAWQLMVEGQTLLQQGDLPGGEKSVMCAFGILPDTPRAKTEACAPMYVMWTQLLYQLGRLPDALAAIEKALSCDGNNPDAVLIKQQLEEIAKSQQNAGQGGS